jgi:small subunit ribosomal protein S21
MEGNASGTADRLSDNEFVDERFKGSQSGRPKVVRTNYAPSSSKNYSPNNSQGPNNYQGQSNGQGAGSNLTGKQIFTRPNERPYSNNKPIEEVTVALSAGAYGSSGSSRSPRGENREGAAGDGATENWSGASSSGGKDGGMKDPGLRPGAMEVYVDHNIEKALKTIKRKLIKEGLFRELKARKHYEKPSEKRKRKTKEAYKKIKKDESRAKKSVLL